MRKLLPQPVKSGNAAIDNAVALIRQALNDIYNELEKTDVQLLQDNTSGTSSKSLNAITDPADSPASADDLRDDLVSNALPAIRNNFASLSAKVNEIVEIIKK